MTLPPRTTYYTWTTKSPFVRKGGRKTLREARSFCYGILTEKPSVKLTLYPEYLLRDPYDADQYGSRIPGTEIGDMYVGKEGIVWYDKAKKKRYILNRDGTLGRRL